MSVPMGQIKQSILNISRESGDALVDDFLKLMRTKHEQIQKFMIQYNRVQASRDFQTNQCTLSIQTNQFRKQFRSAPTDWKAQYNIVISKAILLRKLWELKV